MKTTNKILIVLVAMALVDILIPVPIAVFLLIYVLYQKPAWFKELADEVYS
jgi:TRAP-type C4-dicarboxylate transport system permease small subunit